MRAYRDETDIPMTLTAGLVVSLDDAQARVLSSSSRVWLQRTCMETRDCAEIVLQFLFHDKSANR